MIAYLKGYIIWNDGSRIILKVNDIGYQVEVVDQNIVNKTNKELELYIFTYVREDILALYGFKGLEERELFITLIGVSGIGPKAAMKILSSLSYERFIDAILTENISVLKQVPGIGPKTAQRLILELKNKVEDLALSYNMKINVKSYDEDLFDALLALGYSTSEVDTVLNDIEFDDSMIIEKKIKKALSYLSKER